MLPSRLAVDVDLFEDDFTAFRRFPPGVLDAQAVVVSDASRDVALVWVILHSDECRAVVGRFGSAANLEPRAEDSNRDPLPKIDRAQCCSHSYDRGQPPGEGIPRIPDY